MFLEAVFLLYPEQSFLPVELTSGGFYLTIQIAKLRETNRALDRLTKSKDAALMDAERTVQIAEIKASMVDELQNRNQELMKQIEICQVYWNLDIIKKKWRLKSRCKFSEHRMSKFDQGVSLLDFTSKLFGT